MDHMDKIAAYLKTNGLTAKLAIVAEHSDTLLTQEVEEQVAGLDLEEHYAPELQAMLLKACREMGTEEGSVSFVWDLGNVWLSQAWLSVKANLMEQWADPLLGSEIRNALAAALEQTEDEMQSVSLGWHLRLIDRCREFGVADGIAIHESIDGDSPTDPKDLLFEFESLRNASDGVNILKRISVLKRLIPFLTDVTDTALLEFKADRLDNLASDLALGWIRGFLDADVSSFAHELYDEAIEMYKRISKNDDIAGTMMNQAVLLANQYERGEVMDAEPAHEL